MKGRLLEALRNNNGRYAIVTETTVTNGRTRTKKRRVRADNLNTMLDALHPALIRFRRIKKPGCRCPMPPYLMLKTLPWFPWLEFDWGGPICICEINDILRDI